MDFKGPENKKKRGDFQRPVSTRDEMDKPVSSKKAIFATGTALDNFLILKEIFGYLSPGDLRNCCRVNQTWRSIADSMIFDYQMKWKKLSEVEVRITKGFMDPQIETRTSTIAAESEYLQHLKRAPFVCMEFNLRYLCNSVLVEDCREFFKRIGSKVYKLNYMGTNCARLFFSSEVYNKRDMDSTTTFHCRHFPNLEDLRLLAPDNHHLFWPAYNSWDNFQLLHVQKFYTGQMALNVTTKNNDRISKIFEFMPNVREMYGMPCTIVQELQRRQKLHVLRSVGFYRHDRGWTEDEAMKSLLNSSLKFQFMVIGRNKQSDCGLDFIKRNKQNLEALLEFGKDSLTHLMLRPLKPELIIDLPSEMPAVQHITFRKGGVTKGRLYFKEGEDLSKIFPNLTTITFMDFRTYDWLLAEKWWKWMDLDNILFSKEVCKKIKYLKSTQYLDLGVKEKVLKKFFCVKDIKIITPNRFGDSTIADGIISII